MHHKWRKLWIVWPPNQAPLLHKSRSLISSDIWNSTVKAQLLCVISVIMIETFDCAVFPCIEIKMIGSLLVSCPTRWSLYWPSALCVDYLHKEPMVSVSYQQRDRVQQYTRKPSAQCDKVIRWYWVWEIQRHTEIQIQIHTEMYWDKNVGISSVQFIKEVLVIYFWNQLPASSVN